MSIKCTVYIQHEDNWYVATDIVSGVASQGKTIDESIENLREAGQSLILCKPQIELQNDDII